MYSFTAVALAAASFTTFIQPCPAPPLAAAAFGGIVSAITGNALSKPSKRSDGGAQSGLANCVSESADNPPTMAPGSGTSIIMNNMPQSCLAEIQAYNAHPANGAMAALHGTTTQINSTALRLDGMPHDVLGKISDMIKANPQLQHQRRSARFEKY